MKEKILKLLNIRFKSRYQSLERLVMHIPEAIVCIPAPSFEEFLTFFKAIGSGKDDVKKLNTSTVEKTVLKALRKFPSIKEYECFLNTLLLYPTTLNIINESERSSSDSLFLRALYRRRTLKNVGYDEELISFIKKPSARMKFFSARFEPTSIRLITNAKNRMLNEAVMNNPVVIKYIENPTADMKKVAIGLDISVLGLIKNQTEADAKLAMSLNPSAIMYILPENRTISMTYEAIKEGRLNEFLKYENFLSYKFSVEEIGMMIDYGDRQLRSLVALLVLNNCLDLSEETIEKLNKEFEIGGN